MTRVEEANPVGSSPAGALAGYTALIAEDHEVFRQAIAALLQRDCGCGRAIEASSVEEALHALEEEAGVALATFDLSMPGMAGAKTLRAVRIAFPQVRVVVVSASERREDMIAAITAGAHGFVPKTFDTAQIAAALSTIMGGRIFLPWNVSDISATGDGASADGSAPGISGRLTERQLEVLSLIKTGKSSKEIARVLGLTESTVKVHTNALYRALGVRNRVEAVSVKFD